MTTTLADLKEVGESDCCGASVYVGICSDCNEHCVTMKCVDCDGDGFIEDCEGSTHRCLGCNAPNDFSGATPGDR